jgi:hypothetical protein
LVAIGPVVSEEKIKIVNNIKNLTWGKNYQHIKIYLPCNFEVNLITQLGVIALFSSPGPFHQSLVAIGPVVSEEKIKM